MAGICGVLRPHAHNRIIYELRGNHSLDDAKNIGRPDAAFCLHEFEPRNSRDCRNEKRDERNPETLLTFRLVITEREYD